ncbi:MAG: hypothetical protein AB7U81_06570 [Thiohalomonadaceae bacterium]
MKHFALLLALCCTGAVRGEDGLGRLFTTPEQRRALDRPTETASPPNVEVQAVFRRAGAEPVVLIGGEPVRAGQTTRGGAQVLAIDDTGVELRVPGRAPMKLTPGAVLPAQKSGASP